MAAGFFKLASQPVQRFESAIKLFPRLGRVVLERPQLFSVSRLEFAQCVCRGRLISAVWPDLLPDKFIERLMGQSYALLCLFLEMRDGVAQAACRRFRLRGEYLWLSWLNQHSTLIEVIGKLRSSASSIPLSQRSKAAICVVARVFSVSWRGRIRLKSLSAWPRRRPLQLDSQSTFHTLFCALGFFF